MDASTTAKTQRLEALVRATEVRQARAELKWRIAAGDLAAADVILTPSREAATMSVGEILRSQRRWGKARCAALLRQSPLSEGKTIGSMTARQRRAVADLLPRDS